jgi:hypothetical protein
MTIVTSKVMVADYGECNMITYTPAGISAPTPTIVFTPGNGETGTNVAELYYYGPLKYIKNGWRPKFIVVAVQPLKVYSTYVAPRFLHTMLTAIRKNAYVDTNRLMLTGLSGGGGTTLCYVRNHPAPYRVRAIAVFSIPFYPKCSDGLCGGDLRMKTLPAWGLSGDDDSFTGPMRRYFDFLKKYGCPARWTTYNGGHYGWNAFYNPSWSGNLYGWLLSKAL